MTRAAVPFAGLALAVGVTGCGEKRETTTGPDAGTAPAPAAVTISETEFKLDPSKPRLAEGPVTIRVKNDGTTQHALVLEAPGGEVRTPTLEPGRSTSFRPNLPAGTYTIYCPIDGHRAKGMAGRLTVVAGSG